MRRRTIFSGVVLAGATALALSGCGASQESAPVVIGSLEPAAHSEPPAPPIQALAAPTPADIAAPTTLPPDVYAGMPLIDRTEWTDAVDGRRLLVYPTDAGRADRFPTAADRAWREILTLSPDADTPGMWDQFRCHWEWARLVNPDKPSWNLEPWRPAVGYQETVNALCNPGGPER
ncbi:MULTISPECIES: DUF2599 domain-containing protein [unclassified Nocardia]|uniref:DUF2599 domain-containing protein n=1 Tax=unclassified Nocardia TaxID=2637762 RepID=UPI0024A9D360|nr:MULTISPECIES: DUF2599 domain-containing protein [unclassified Nocardia]